MGKQSSLVFLLLAVTSWLSYACGASASSQPDSISPASVSVSDESTASVVATPGRFVLGYYTGSQSSYDAFLSFSAYLDIVSADIFSIQPDGCIAGSDDFGVVAYDQSHDIQTYACVNNYNGDPAVDDFDLELARTAILAHKDKVILSLVQIALDGGFDGINIDFENIAYSANIEDDRMAFTSFIYDLAGQLHANDKKLIISVPSKTTDSPQDSWSYPFDLTALGQDADYLQLMTYDQHGPWGEPGPVSGKDWVEDCVAYASSLVDPSKLLLGLPAYGYDWDLTASDPDHYNYSATGFSWVDVPQLLAKPGAEIHWDAVTQSPYVTYTEAGHEHVAWYENAESIRAKVDLVLKYNLAGLSMWSLGQEDLSFWQAAVDGIK